MNRFPVKLPLALAFCSALPIPAAAIGYVGLYALELSGLLSIFGTLSTVLDVLLPVALLAMLWGNAYLLSAFLKSLPDSFRERKTLGGLFRLLLVFAVALGVLSPLYSVFPKSLAVCVAWTFAFSIELVAGVALGLALSVAAFRRKNWLVLGLGLAVSLFYLTDFGGCRVFQSMLDYQFGNVALFDWSGETDNGPLTYLWGISPAELDTLDGESLADIQEVTFAFGILSVALFAGLVSAHAASSVLVFALFAIYFKRRKTCGVDSHPKEFLC